MAVASSVISVWFYLGLVAKMYFAEPSGEGHAAPSGLAGVTLAVCTAAVVLLGIFPGILNRLVGIW